jgi:hypothetical protein
MFFNLLILLTTFFFCLLGSWIYAKILSNQIPIWVCLFSGLANTLLWLALIKLTKANLIALSAWFDAVSAFGYFVGFMLMGQSVSGFQIIGMILLIAGLAFINF